jgi:hypothetical protein
MKHKHSCFLAVTVINITSIKSYYHSLLFPTLVLPVLLTLRDGRILMWEGGQLASVDTGYFVVDLSVAVERCVVKEK